MVEVVHLLDIVGVVHLLDMLAVLHLLEVLDVLHFEEELVVSHLLELVEVVHFLLLVVGVVHLLLVVVLHFEELDEVVHFEEVVGLLHFDEVDVLHFELVVGQSAWKALSGLSPLSLNAIRTNRCRGGLHTTGVAVVRVEPDRLTLRLTRELLAVDVPAIPLTGRAAPERGVAIVVGQRTCRRSARWKGRSGRMLNEPLQVRPKPLVGLAPSSHWKWCQQAASLRRSGRALTCYCVVGGVKIQPRCFPSITPGRQETSTCLRRRRRRSLVNSPPLEPRQYFPSGKLSSPMRFCPSESWRTMPPGPPYAVSPKQL